MGQYTQAVATIAGYYIGSLYGYPQLGAVVGAAFGAALQPAQKMQGAHLNDLKAPAFSYGSSLPLIRGRYRTAGAYLWASDKREIANTTEQGKGASTEITNYTYEIDALIQLSTDVISGVSRIWSNGELVYTALAGSSDASLAASGANERWRGLVIYTGSATQLPDPDYEAAVGIGNAPAYRGRGTIFIKGLQLGSSGQLPVLTFEVIGSGTHSVSNFAAGPTVAAPVYWAMGTPAGSTGVLRCHVGAWTASNGYANLVNVFDVDLFAKTQTWVGSYTATGYNPSANTHNTCYGHSDIDCFMFSAIADGTPCYLFSGNTGSRTAFTLPHSPGTDMVFSRLGGDIVFSSRSNYNNFTKQVFKYGVAGGSTPVSSSPTLPQYVNDVIIIGDRVYAASGATDGAIYVLALSDLSLITTLTVPAGYGGFHGGYQRLFEIDGCVGIVNTQSENQFVPQLGTWRYDVGQSAWVRIGTLTSGTGVPTTQIGSTMLVVGNLLISTLSSPSGTPQLQTFSSQLVVNPGQLDMAAEVAYLCQAAGLQSTQVDASSLAGLTIDGYAVTQISPVRSTLEMLANAFYFECTESDKLYFRRRGGSSAATISFSDLGAAEGEAAVENPMGLERANDTELPTRYSLSYVNLDDDYQTGSVFSDRLVGVGQETSAVQVPIVMSPERAKGIADTMVIDARIGATTFRPAITWADPRIEPTDVLTLIDEDGTQYRARVRREVLSPGRKELECVLDDASILQLTGTTESDYTPSTTVLAPANTQIVLMDIPILRDDDDVAGIYVAGKSLGGKWPGFTVMRSTDDSAFSNVGEATKQATLGTCTTTLGAWSGGTMFDEVNSVTVNVGASSTLASYTRDDILNGVAAGYMVGAELLYARDATLVSAGIYKLTGLLRGRRGTELAMASHGASEAFVVLAPSGIVKTVLSDAEIGRSFFWRGVTMGRSLGTATSQTKADTGVAVKPFSPVDVRGYRDGSSGAIGLTWKRRTRLSCRFTGPSGIYVPLGEDSEAYEVDVFADGTFTAVKRTLSASAAAVSYTVEQQVADFGSLPSVVYAKVYQIGKGGRGYPAQASVSGIDVIGHATVLYPNGTTFITSGVDTRSSGAIFIKTLLPAGVGAPCSVLLPDATGACLDLPFGTTGWKQVASAQATAIGLTPGSAYQSAWGAVAVFLAGAGVFQRVEWVGNGGGARDITHALGIAPAMAMVKGSDISEQWWMYSSAAGAGVSLRTPDTSAPFTPPTFGTDANAFPSTSTSSALKVGSSLNVAGINYCALLFADTGTEVDAGTYTGNGTTTGTAISLGWEPDVLIIRAINGSGSYTFITAAALKESATGATHWFMDSATSPFYSAVVSTSSTGFQAIANDLAVNESGTTYHYWARKR